MVASASKRSKEAEGGKAQRGSPRRTQRCPRRRADKPGPDEPAKCEVIRGEEPPNQAWMRQLAAGTRARAVVVPASKRSEEEAEGGEAQGGSPRRTQRCSRRGADRPGPDEPAKREGVRGRKPPNQARMGRLAAEHEGPRGGSLGLETKRRGRRGGTQRGSPRRTHRLRRQGADRPGPDEPISRRLPRVPPLP